MLQRCMSLLMESKAIWPLASRWLESLERYSRDPKAAAVSLDRGMADGVSEAPLFATWSSSVLTGSPQDDRTLRPLHIGHSPSTSGHVQKAGSMPASLKLPGPSTPGEDSKHNVFLLPSSASPDLPQSLPAYREQPHGLHDKHIRRASEQAQRAKQHGRQHDSEQQRFQHQGMAHDQGIHPQPLPQPLPAPMAHIPPHGFMYSNQRMTQPQHVYQQQPPPYSPQTPMNMLAQAAFDQPSYQPGPSHMVSTETPSNGQMYQLPQLHQAQTAYDSTAPPPFFTPPTPTVALGPGNDGFEGELQSWFDASTQGNIWVGNGMGVGYSI